VARQGLRIGDIEKQFFLEKYNHLKELQQRIVNTYKVNISNFEIDGLSFNEYEKLWFDSLEILKQFQAIDSEYFINQAIDNNKKVLAEGAQGTMLDIDFGSYPFVTSSNTVSAGVCSGLGVAPSKIGKVIMVTKDVNLRIKAKAVGLTAEDFLTGRIENIDSLYSGISRLENVDKRGIDRLYEEGLCEVEDLNIENPKPNQYFILQTDGASALGYYNPRNQLIERVDKHTVSKINPRNAEQVFALHAVTNPNIRLVTLQGIAGTGKTLLALAGAWSQRRNYKQLFLARPIVPLSNKDIGFLPGDAKLKIEPYMQPLYDNLRFIQNQFGEHDKEFQNITAAMQNEKLVIQPLAYIRGRSISNVFFIVDEAQNLTPHEVKTIITRAGEGTKIIFTGDIYQIDTPYLDSQSNGLSYLIDRVKHHNLYAHVRLEKGERSDLANLANEML
jgi:PhoH-like ATPase